MAEKIIVVAASIKHFHVWCYDNNENPRDRKFLYVFDPSDVLGYHPDLGYDLHLLVLYGGLEKILKHEVELREDGYYVIPNPLYLNLESVFMKSWSEIETEAVQYGKQFNP